ncbi:MAG: NAD(P)H-binding protein [Caulobacteraceae bacterium]
MKIAVIGATGNVGGKVLGEALSRGHQVTAIARNTDKLDKASGATIKSADISDSGGITAAIGGSDAVVITVKHQTFDLMKALDAIRAAGIKRVMVVGGAASLKNKDGVRLLDQPGFPDFIKVEAAPAAVALDNIRGVTDLDWSFISPSMMLGPGERVGKFRLGGDDLIVDDKGDSKISYDDLAVAIVDELETPKHIRKRFTAGY